MTPKTPQENPSPAESRGEMTAEQYFALIPEDISSDWQYSNHFELRSPSTEYFWYVFPDVDTHNLNCESEEGKRLGLIMDFVCFARRELQAAQSRIDTLTYENNRLKHAEGYRCWHCGERFTTPGSANDHFGTSQGDKPGCVIKVGEERGLLMELRRTQAKLREKALPPGIVAVCRAANCQVRVQQEKEAADKLDAIGGIYEAGHKLVFALEETKKVIEALTPEERSLLGLDGEGSL